MNIKGTKHTSESDWKEKIELILSEVKNLSIDEKWAYFRWEWLRRNKFYRGIKKTDFSYEGIFNKFHRINDLIPLKFKDNVQKIKSSQKILSLEFCGSCGLLQPVDPIEGRWQKCKWANTNTDLLFKDMKEYGGFRGGSLNLNIRKERFKVTDLAKRSYQFPRAIDIEYFDRYESGIFIHDYKKLSQPKMLVYEYAEGLVIWDIKNSKKTKHWTYEKVTSALGISAKNLKSDADLDNKIWRVREQFKSTSKKIRQSINSEYLSHWK